MIFFVFNILNIASGTYEGIFCEFHHLFSYNTFTLLYMLLNIFYRCLQITISIQVKEKIGFIELFFYK